MRSVRAVVVLLLAVMLTSIAAHAMTATSFPLPHRAIGKHIGKSGTRLVPAILAESGEDPRPPLTSRAEAPDDAPPAAAVTIDLFVPPRA
jgi:hypothetical protein